MMGDDVMPMRPSEALLRLIDAKAILQVRLDAQPILRTTDPRLTEARQAVAEAANQFDLSIASMAGSATILDTVDDHPFLSKLIG
jgi:hypothetical protein